ncbi:MAG: hypothetical protein NZ585_03905 [Chloracidobacterium sp.]|nr:hypothetical protein [Chloracidobacterium sp.]MDW8217499.1 hypothetical protein [Acidobacteriota bacterium]
MPCLAHAGFTTVARCAVYIAFLLGSLGWPLTLTAGQRVKPGGASRSVVDYFLAIPDQYLPEPSRTRRRELLRPEHVTVRDERNGYLQVAGDGARPTVTIAKFRKTDGTFLVVMTADYELGSVCHAFDDRNGQLVDVSRAVIPDYAECRDFEADDCRIYDLPRYGTTIIVKDGQNRRRYALRWRGDRFERAP